MTELIIIFSIEGLILIGVYGWLRKCSAWLNSLNEREEK